MIFNLAEFQALAGKENLQAAENLIKKIEVAQSRVKRLEELMPFITRESGSAGDIEFDALKQARLVFDQEAANAKLSTAIKKIEAQPVIATQPQIQVLYQADDGLGTYEFYTLVFGRQYGGEDLHQVLVLIKDNQSFNPWQEQPWVRIQAVGSSGLVSQDGQSWVREFTTAWIPATSLANDFDGEFNENSIRLYAGVYVADLTNLLVRVWITQTPEAVLHGRLLAEKFLSNQFIGVSGRLERLEGFRHWYFKYEHRFDLEWFNLVSGISINNVWVKLVASSVSEMVVVTGGAHGSQSEGPWVQPSEISEGIYRTNTLHRDRDSAINVQVYGNSAPSDSGAALLETLNVPALGPSSLQLEVYGANDELHMDFHFTNPRTTELPDYRYNFTLVEGSAYFRNQGWRSAGGGYPYAVEVIQVKYGTYVTHEMEEEPDILHATGMYITLPQANEEGLSVITSFNVQLEFLYENIYPYPSVPQGWLADYPKKFVSEWFVSVDNRYTGYSGNYNSLVQLRSLYKTFEGVVNRF